MALEDICRAVVDQAATRTTPFLKIDLVNTAKRNKHIEELFDWCKRMPKKIDVRGIVNEAIENHVGRELQRQNNGWRVFESFPDPEGHSGRNRLFMPLRFMTLAMLDGAEKQVRQERRELVNKEERYAILKEFLRAAGPRAKVGDVLPQVEAEIERRRAASA